MSGITEAVVIFEGEPSDEPVRFRYTIELPAHMVEGKCKEWLRNQIKGIYRHLHTEQCTVEFDNDIHHY